MTKRVSGKYHLTLYKKPTYKGFPLLDCRNGFVEKYLERLYCAIDCVVHRYSKFFAVRVDLHFPQHYIPYDQAHFSNETLHSFFKVLRRRLKTYMHSKQKVGQRVHDVDFEYAWAREYGPKSDRPHFHLLLLFSGHAFNSLGRFSCEQESLYNRICESWGRALGIHVTEGYKFVYFPENGQYLVVSRDSDRVAKVFRRASYLAKVTTKHFHDGYHVFGGSRL